MGSACSLARNLKIEAKLKEERRHQEKHGNAIVKMLMLGAGESGKSTIIKQMKIIHDTGYTIKERKQFEPIVIGNTIASLSTILRAMTDLQIDYADKATADDAHKFFVIVSLLPDGELTDDLADLMITLWEDEGVREAYRRRSDFQLNDSAAYFLDRISSIREPDYIPSEQDVVHTRVKTTGISEVQFFFRGLHFRMYDMGGQRAERKKWIHCFENVHAIIFCVALSEYDQVLEEDRSMNRMKESLRLFGSICNNKWFEMTSMILFLNKTDIFQEKILQTPLNVCFDDYKGENNFADGAFYVELKFRSLNNRAAQGFEEQQLYTFQTCATETNNIRLVFGAITDMLIKKTLAECGVL